MRFTFVVLLSFMSLQKSIAQKYVKEILHDKIPVQYHGKAIDAYEYKDAAGLHIYLATKISEEKPTEKVTIFGNGYTAVNGSYVKDWSITDFSDLDVVLKYTYTKIVDIDNDGIYETIFVYELDPNAGEGSTWKLMLHYKNQKYALRVHIPELDDDEYKVTFDRSFATLPKAIKTYIINYWNNIADEQGFKGWYLLK